jgi:hypothetical protein
MAVKYGRPRNSSAADPDHIYNFAEKNLPARLELAAQPVPLPFMDIVGFFGAVDQS